MRLQRVRNNDTPPRRRGARLRETDADNRLTVDVDSSRLDIGRAASEVEREWLYQMLADRYAIRS